MTGEKKIDQDHGEQHAYGLATYILLSLLIQRLEAKGLLSPTEEADLWNQGRALAAESAEEHRALGDERTAHRFELPGLLIQAELNLRWAGRAREKKRD